MVICDSAVSQQALVASHGLMIYNCSDLVVSSVVGEGHC